MKDPFKVVQTVVVTEKATDLSDDLNQYTFKVDKNATKKDIKFAVERIFDVKVGQVNVMNRQGKRKRQRQGSTGKRPDWRKAMVQVVEGQIDII